MNWGWKNDKGGKDSEALGLLYDFRDKGMNHRGGAQGGGRGIWKVNKKIAGSLSLIEIRGELGPLHPLGMVVKCAHFRGGVEWPKEYGGALYHT